MHISHHEPPRKRPVNLTIREDIMAEAKRLDINTSKAAETGIENAVLSKKAEVWRTENAAAIEAHNRRVEQDGVLIKPRWLDE